VNRSLLFKYFGFISEAEIAQLENKKTENNTNLNIIFFTICFPKLAV